MGETGYRITNEQEFYDKALNYVDFLADKFSGTIDERFTDKKRKREITKKCINYLNLKFSDDSTREQVLRAGVNLLMEDVDDWCNASCSKSSTQEEIILRLLISRIFNCDFISTLMVSCNKNMTENFIKDCIYVSSSLFKFDEWDAKHVEAVSSCAASGLPANKCKELIELYGKKRLTDKHISVKFDFNAFNLNNLSEDFKNKFYVKDNYGRFVARR